MPVLEYRARSEDGRLHTGRAEQSQLGSLRDDLRVQGLFLVEVKTVSPGRFIRRSVSRREVILIAYHLQTVVRAGIPLITGLRDLSAQTDNRYLQNVIDDVIDSVGSGSSLSQALGRHPAVFPTEFVQMSMAGELSGKLDEALDRLVHLLEWKEQLAGQVKQLVAYPIIVLIALFGLVVLLLTFVLPKFGGILESLHVELPLPTRLLLASSEFVLQNWVWIIAFAILATIVTIAGKRVERLHLAFDRWSLHLPLYGSIRLSLISSQVSHFLSAFIDAGVPIGDGLEMIVGLSGNTHAKKILERIRQRVFEGDTLSDAFKDSQLFPILVLRMISIGEESGTLPESLQKAGDFYDREIPRRVKEIMGIATPMITVLLASILCFVILAVLLPIYKMYGALA